MKAAKIWYIVILFFCILGLSLQLKATRRKPTSKSGKTTTTKAPSGYPGHSVKPGKTTTTKAPSGHPGHSVKPGKTTTTKAPSGHPGHSVKPDKTTTTRAPNANQHTGKTTTTKAPSGNQNPGHRVKPDQTTTAAPTGNQNPGHPVKPEKTTTTKAPHGDRHPVEPKDPGQSVQPGTSEQQSTCEEKESCTIDVSQMKPEHALIVDPSNHNKLVYPDSRGEVVIDQGHKIYLVCSGVDNRFVKLTGQYHEFTCECGTTFKSTVPNAEDEYHFEDLTCLNIPEAKYVPMGSKTISTITIDRFDVGFKTDDGEGFVTVLEAHHNSKAQLTKYVKSRLPRSAKYALQPFDWNTFFETHPGRFVQEPHKHHRVSLHKMYYAAEQRASLKQQFPLKNKENEEKGLLLDRGHLAPRRDMIYVPEGLATYTYINTVPQWNLINQHNWEAIESYVRNMAAALRRDLTVITGSYKRLHYPDEKDARISKMVYLYYDKHGPQCPVPLATYKIVVDPTTKRGLVFVTSNDPYLALAEITPANRLCTEILHVDNLTLKTIIKYGYSYVCSVKAFLEKTELRYLFDQDVLEVTGNLNEKHVKAMPVPVKVKEQIQN